MRIPYYHIDAFITGERFSGNPAGVCFLPEWLPDDVLQAMAAEHNLSETAFLIERDGFYDLRWFTPSVEVDLCGHATLAPAHLILHDLHPELTEVRFQSQSGMLTATKCVFGTEINFPARPPRACAAPDGLAESLGVQPEAVLKARDYLVVLQHEQELRTVVPDMMKLAKLDAFAVIVTAPGDTCDFVSRFFAPAAGVPEDPVTGSAHSTLVPYWAERLGKEAMHAFQRSARGGELWLTHAGDRTRIAGQCAVYFQTELAL